MNKKKIIGDVILASVLIILGAAALLIWRGTAEEGSVVQVTVDGKEVGRYSLATDAEIKIEGIGGENLLIIKDGKADVTDASCPDKICVDHRAISKSGETIVCLPHKVVVKIASDADDGLDMAA